MSKLSLEFYSSLSPPREIAFSTNPLNFYYILILGYMQLLNLPIRVIHRQSSINKCKYSFFSNVFKMVLHIAEFLCMLCYLRLMTHRNGAISGRIFLKRALLTLIFINQWKELYTENSNPRCYRINRRSRDAESGRKDLPVSCLSSFQFRLRT